MTTDIFSCFFFPSCSIFFSLPRRDADVYTPSKPQKSFSPLALCNALALSLLINDIDFLPSDNSF